MNMFCAFYGLFSNVTHQHFAILLEAVLKYNPQLRGEELDSTFLQEKSQRMFRHY